MKLNFQSPTKTRDELIGRVVDANQPPQHLRSIIPRLFRPLPRRRGKRPAYQNLYYRGDVVAHSKETLGANDLKVAQALITLGWDEFEKYGPSDFDPCFSNDWDRFEAESVTVQTDFTQLTRLMGASSPAGSRNAAIRKSIWRLATTRITVSNRKSHPGRTFTLLRINQDPEATKGVDVGLHLLTLTALAADTKMALTILREANQLPSEMSRLIHGRLSGCFSPGLMRSLTMDTLYGDLAPKREISASYKRRCRHVIRQGVRDLSKAGWNALEVGDKRFLITRPRIE